MANVYPFQAVRPPAEKASAVSALPYDVMSRAEALRMAAANHLSILHVTRSEIDLPPDCNPYADTVYEKARSNYHALKSQVPLVKDTVPAYYIYALESDGRRQIGIAATPALEDYTKDIVKKHEKTRRQKEDDRTQHILTVGAQTGPVFLTYRDQEKIEQIVDFMTTNTEPLMDFAADNGVRNTIWKVSPEKTGDLQRCFAELPALYIADGHHRAASAARVCETLLGKSGDRDLNSPAARFLAVLFPASQLRILAYNRVVEGLNGWPSEEFLARLKAAHFRVAKTDLRQPVKPRQICMYLNGEWYCLEFIGDLSGMPEAETLDVAILQREILTPILDVHDPRMDERIDFIGGIRGTGALQERVDTGQADVAFSMFPTTVEQLMAVSDAGEMMPPKSTWFEPKLRDGLLIHEIGN